MDIALKIIIFLVINVAGSFISPLMFHIAVMLGLLPDGQDKAAFDQFLALLGGGGLWVWILCAFLSLGFLAFDGRKRYVFLSLPVIGPLLYGAGVLILF